MAVLGVETASAQTQVRTSLSDTVIAPAPNPADNRLRPTERPVVYRAAASLNEVPTPVNLYSLPASAAHQPSGLPPTQMQTRLPEEE